PMERVPVSLRLWPAVILPLAALLSSCSPPPSPPSATAPLVSTPLSDPAVALRPTLEKFRRDGTRPRVVPSPAGGWLKRRFLPRDLNWEVHTTESVVSPFVAILTWKDAYYCSAGHATRDEADQAVLPLFPTPQRDTASNWAELAFQEGRWLLR